MRKKLKRKSDQEIYQCDELTARPGAIVEMTLMKYNQLLRDFPDEWELVDEEPKPEDTKPVKVNSPHKVSVIIPSYNMGHFLPKAIESILNQTYDNIEIIVVNDGSTDDTAEVVSQYPTVIFVDLQHNQGIAHALNEGIKKSTGEFINWLSADDWYEPICVQTQMEAFVVDPNLEMVYSAYNLKYADDYYEVTVRNKTIPRHPMPPHDTKSLLKKNTRGCFVYGSTVSIRKILFDEIGLFDESLQICQDWEFSLRIMQRERFKLIDETLVTRLEHNDNLSVKVAEFGPSFDKKLFKKWNAEQKLVADKYQKDSSAPAVSSSSYEPLVSIIIPVYNREDLIYKTIKSATSGGKQSYTKVEVLVVDDASTDNTQHTIQQFTADKRVKYIGRKKNGGVAEALNTGIKHSTGKYVCWLSSDDFFSDKDKIRKQLLRFRANPNLRLVHSEFNVVWEDNNIDSTVHKIPDLKTGGEKLDYHLNKECLINGSSVMMDRRLFKEIGLFNPAYRYCQDTDFWMRALANAEVECIHEPLVSNLQHKGILGNEYNEPKTDEQKFNRQVFEKEKEMVTAQSRMFTRKHPTICAMICMKNEEKIIEQTLNDLVQWVDYIVIFNDGSTDNSPEIVRQYPKVVDMFNNPPKGNKRTEAKDRKRLYKMAKATGADWILFIDADEVFENRIKWVAFDLLNDQDINLYYALEINFWRSLTRYRTDEMWYRGWFPRIFRNLDGLTWGKTNEHSGGVPNNIPGATMFPSSNSPKGKKIEPRMKHYHFADWNTTVKKYMLLMERDPEHFEEGSQRGGANYYDRVIDETGLTLAEYEGDKVSDYLRRGEI